MAIPTTCSGCSATQASTSATALSVSIHSVVHGHHVYKEIWTPYVEEMLALQQKIGNVHNRFAVAVMAQPATTIISRVPRELHNKLYRIT